MDGCKSSCTHLKERLLQQDGRFLFTPIHHHSSVGITATYPCCELSSQIGRSCWILFVFSKNPKKISVIFSQDLCCNALLHHLEKYCSKSEETQLYMAACTNLPVLCQLSGKLCGCIDEDSKCCRGWDRQQFWPVVLYLKMQQARRWDFVVCPV